MLPIVTPYANLVTSRLFDFFGKETPWQRRLWVLGTMLAGREVLEASEAHRLGVLGEQSLRSAVEAFREAVKVDAGIDEPEKKAILQCLDDGNRKKDQLLPYNGVPFRRLQQLLDEISGDYLSRWSKAVALPKPPRAERTARAIASHLLDLGYSTNFLHRWWRYRIQHDPAKPNLPQIVEDASELAKQGPQQFKVLIAFQQAPQVVDMPPEWLPRHELAKWFRHHKFDNPPRQAGGLLVTVSARDNYSAAENAADILDRLMARVAIGSKHKLTPHASVWLPGEKKQIPLRRVRRVEVHSLSRAGKVFTLAAPATAVDRALELLAPLVSGPPGPSVSGAWAAIESVLSGPGDGTKSRAAGRMAALVTCSFPRAELTRLAWNHTENVKDELSDKIAQCSSNQERVKVIAQYLADGKAAAVPQRQSDAAAFDRMERLLQNPGPVLEDVRRYVVEGMRRLYRQRNLIVHRALTEAVALPATLRTVAPLVGAGFDRIAHAWLVSSTDPLELAARAENTLALVGASSRVSPLELLD